MNYDKHQLKDMDYCMSHANECWDLSTKSFKVPVKATVTTMKEGGDWFLNKSHIRTEVVVPVGTKFWLNNDEDMFVSECIVQKQFHGDEQVLKSKNPWRCINFVTGQQVRAIGGADIKLDCKGSFLWK